MHSSDYLPRPSSGRSQFRCSLSHLQQNFCQTSPYDQSCQKQMAILESRSEVTIQIRVEGDLTPGKPNISRFKSIAQYLLF